MGLSASSTLLWLGLALWLTGERVFAATRARTWLGAAAGLCFGLSFALDVLAQRGLEPELRTGRLFRSGAGALVALAAAIYAGSGWAGLDVTASALAFAWVVPLSVGITGRLAADRAYRAAPRDAARLVARVRAGLTFGMALSLVAFVNYEVATHDWLHDFSYRTAAEPSAQVRELVTQLRQHIELRLFFERGSEVRAALSPYVDALARISPQLTLRIEDAALSPDLLRKYQVRGNGYALLLAGEGDAQRGESFHIGDDLRDARRVLRTLDAHIANHLSVLARPVRLVYLTTGHGERSVAGDIAESRGRWLRELEQLLARFNVRTQRLGVADGLARGVPADAAAVLVLGAERPFLQEEAAALRTYAEQGGRLLIALEPGVDAGLDSVLSLVGVAPQGAPLLCTESFVVRSRTAADREIIQTRRYPPHPITQTVRRKSERPHVVFVRATALSLAAPESRGLRATVVESEADCFVDVNGDHERSATEPTGSFPLLVAGTLPGAREGRIVVTGDADLPTDQVLRNEANTLIVLDALRWLVGDDVMHAVPMLDDDLPVLHQRTEDRLWFYASAFGVPAPLFALALALLRRRQRNAARA